MRLFNYVLPAEGFLHVFLFSFFCIYCWVSPPDCKSQVNVFVYPTLHALQADDQVLTELYRIPVLFLSSFQ